MIRATLETEKVKRMEEGELHKWLEERGFEIAKPIERREPVTGLTLFEQPPDTTYPWEKSNIREELDRTP